MTGNLFGPVCILIYLFVLDWRMALLSLVSIPVGMLFMMLVMIGYGEKYAGSVRTSQEMNAAIVEYTGGIEAIKAFNQGKNSYVKYTDKVITNAAYYYNWMKSCQFPTSLAKAVMPTTLITVLPAGWLLYSAGSLSVETFITTLILSLGIAGPLLAAMNFMDSLAKIGTIVGTVDEILNGEEQHHSERLVKLGGHDLKDIPLTQLYDQVAFVSQDNYLFDESIRENIRMGQLAATDTEVEAVSKAAGCDAFIRKLERGYDTVVGRGGAHLSGGERQRIAIARAILKDAPIVILDEATASINPENEHLIQAALSELTRGKTIITIAHRLATIQNADQILVVDDGRMVQRGTHRELAAQPGRYRSFVETRQRAEGWNIA